jgi:hypothetical protein
MWSRQNTSYRIIVMFLGACYANGQFETKPTPGGESIQITGGSVLSGPGTGISVGSTLSIRSFVVNDKLGPITLDDAQLSRQLRTGGNYFVMKAIGKVTGVKPGATILGFRIVFRLYDVFGDYFRDLEDTYITDLTPGKDWPLDRLYTWNSAPEEIEKLLFVVSFVDDVRYKSGTEEFVWRANKARVREVANAEILKHHRVDPSKSQ